ncbi:MAG: MOSC domain-containing protein [Halobacteriota archaeon]|uniref:MOSC domain-containing protein n=1 Tax=Natronomonas sp. TaxID=2184060 RepID=UPI003975A2E0
MATISNISVYPIKGLNAEGPDVVEVAEAGSLNYDRKYALFSEDNEYVNGRRNPEIQRVRSAFDFGEEIITLWTDMDETKARFHLGDEAELIEAWFSDFFDEQVRLEEANTNYTDNAGALSRKMITTAGPSIMSRATLEAVASWFPDLIDGPEEMRRRARPNIVVDGVEPFWEDRLYADEDHLVTFEIGDVSMQGLRPLPRCSVPAQNPDSGELLNPFVKEFTRRRRETFPPWGDPELLGVHDELDVGDYYLAVVTRIPTSEWGKRISVGDPVSIDGEAPLITAL